MPLGVAKQSFQHEYKIHKKMKLLKLTTAYPIYIRKFYRSRPSLGSHSYNEQKEKMDYDAYGWADFWSHALKPLGYDVTEVTINVKPMQLAWARENGIAFSERSWLTDIPYEQIRYFKPDILFVEESSAFTQEWLKKIRDNFPAIQLFITWCGAPYRDGRVFHSYDLILSCIPEMVAEFVSRGHDSRHVNHAFEPRVLKRIRLDGPKTIDFSFVGQIARGKQMHIGRERILQKLATFTDIQIYSPVKDAQLAQYLKDLIKGGIRKILSLTRRLGLDLNVTHSNPGLRELATLQAELFPPLSGAIRSKLLPSVFGLAMFQTLRDSKITFNNHIDISPVSASNMRLFEATGVGSCLVTDWKENIKELFEPDSEIVTYRTADECIEKVRWLLDSPGERTKIANAGQARTLKDHTFRQRAEMLDEIIRQKMKRR